MNERDELILGQLQEISKWLRILALPTLRTSLVEALRKPEERRVYQATDGRSQKEASTAAGVATGTVSNYWRRWAKAGLVDGNEKKGYMRLVDLNDIGIEVEKLDA